MKKLMMLIAVFALVFGLAACQEEAEVTPEEFSYENGRYRGVYIDRDEVQVVVQFDLVDNVITSASFRWLAYDGVDYRAESENETIIGMKGQHEEALQYLVGKDIRDHLVDLYTPGDLGIEDVDGFTGATIRSNKIVSAIRDALNRGVYQYRD